MKEARDLRLLADELEGEIKKLESALVAFSGGVDSSTVAALAYRALGDRALAVTINSPLLPHGELEEAVKVARAIGIRHRVVELNELELPGFSDNPQDRCYICKKARLALLKELASKEGFRAILDGTTKSDLSDHRPGIRAAIEEGVRSPLLEAGLSKGEVRELAKLLGLPNHDRPPSSCLATRIPYGQRITLEKLRRVDLAERVVKERLGASLVRVRLHGDDVARIEVSPRERRLFFSEEVLDFIASELKRFGFRVVALDLEGYRAGN
jgi:uncharacterized protein